VYVDNVDEQEILPMLSVNHQDVGDSGDKHKMGQTADAPVVLLLLLPQHSCSHVQFIQPSWAECFLCS